MGYKYLNLLDLPELLQIVVTLTTVIKPLLPNSLGRAIRDLMYRFRKIVRKSNFLEQFRILTTIIK